VLWRAEPVDGKKPKKVPYRVATPDVKASHSDPATWATFDDAVEALFALTSVDPATGRVPGEDRVRGPVVGLGVVLTREAGITCIDLDGVIDDDGVLDPRAETIVSRARSWTEISPSGRGLHVFVRGALPEPLIGAQVQIYSTLRFMALTGHRWPGTPATLDDAQAYLDALYAHAHGRIVVRRPYTGPSAPPPDDLAGALLAKLTAWGVPFGRLERWADGYLVELRACPWAAEHTTGPSGAAVIIHASGAFDFVCQHAHCAGRRWSAFRAAMETAR
jgi:hypothetical protein